MPAPHHSYLIAVTKTKQCTDLFLAMFFAQSNPSSFLHWSAVHQFPCHLPISTTQKLTENVSNTCKDTGKSIALFTVKNLRTPVRDDQLTSWHTWYESCPHQITKLPRLAFTFRSPGAVYLSVYLVMVQYCMAGQERIGRSKWKKMHIGRLC